MAEDDEAALRAALAAAVPPLTAPADRIEEVAGRVRRGRRRRAALLGGTAVVVAALLVVPALALRGSGPARAPAAYVAPSPSAIAAVPLDSADCPTEFPQGKPADAPGPLVPAGAVAVTWCERGYGTLPGGPPADPVRRRLTTNVAEMVAGLNASLTEDAFRAMVIAREREAGRPTDNIGWGACTLIGFATEIALVVQFQTGPPEALWVDRNCGTVFSTIHERHMTSPSLLDQFRSLYRDQLAAATDPGTVAAHACAATQPAGAFDRNDAAREPDDGMAALRNTHDPLSPLPILRLSACRYAVDAAGPSALTGQVAVTTGLDSARTVLNDAATVRSKLESNGSETFDNGTTCGEPASSAMPRLVDLVYLTDTTGATTELRVIRHPCTGVVRNGFGALQATPDLLSLLDSWLGPA